jgi:hypothetical protein
MNPRLKNRGLNMNRTFVVLLALIISGLSLNQPVPAEAATRIMPGTLIPAELSKQLDAKKLKAGDKIEAKIAVDLLSEGQVLIPKDSKILGHISDVKARSKDSKDSMIGIVFDTLSTKDGGELAIQSVIQAIGRPIEQDSNGSSMAGGPIGSSGASLPSGPGGGPTSSGSRLNSASEGVVGMKDLSLSTSGQASVISSSKENVKLEGGTQMILRIQ